MSYRDLRSMVIYSEIYGNQSLLKTFICISYKSQYTTFQKFNLLNFVGGVIFPPRNTREENTEELKFTFGGEYQSAKFSLLRRRLKIDSR